MEGTVGPGHIRTSPIPILIEFMNISRQADVVCINFYLKSLIIDRETNRKSFMDSNVGLVPWGDAELGYDCQRRTPVSTPAYI